MMISQPFVVVHRSKNNNDNNVYDHVRSCVSEMHLEQMCGELYSLPWGEERESTQTVESDTASRRSVFPSHNDAG